MATIFPRINRDGSTTWRVMFRRKGLKSFITGFSSEEKAIEFCQKYEKIYVLDPGNFNYDALKSRREREFDRKK